MLDAILKEAEEKMQKSLENTKDKFSHVRAGRASVSMLDGVTVEAYGTQTPLNQVGTVSAPEARLLVIDPWDKTLIPVIEKTILQANLGFNPSKDGKVIRLVVPELTEERRKEYVKMVKKEAEEGKVAIRNVRKDVNNKLRKLEKDSEITEDELKSSEEKVQKSTDKYIAQVDDALSKKEKECEMVIVSSASPLFLIEKFLLSLGYDKVFGTNFVNDNKETFIAKIDGENNKGDEKVKKLDEWAKQNDFEYEITEFYSDSLADKPLYDISKKTYWIKNGVKLDGMPPRKTLFDKLFWK